MTNKAKAVIEKLHRGLRGRKADDYFGHYTSRDDKFIFGLSAGDSILATIELSAKDGKRLVETILMICEEMEGTNYESRSNQGK